MKQHFLLIRLTAVILAFSLLLSLAACGKAPAVSSDTDGTKSSSSKVVKAGELTKGISAEKVKGKAPDSTFAASQYSFAAELFRRSYGTGGSSCLVSPLSVMLALAMTANGASGGTLQQMLNVLGRGITLDDLNAYLYEYVKNLPSSDKSKLAIANSIWLAEREDFSVREDFLKKDVSWYNAQVYKLPFDDKAVKEINSWVSKNTDKMIKKIVDSLSDRDLMMLINAVCFDAKWASPYLNNDVTEVPFTLSDGSTQPVSMMYSSEYEYYEGEGYTGFAKHYANGYKFVGILPDEETGLDRFIETLDGEKLSVILRGKTDTKVIGGLPKFTYEYQVELKEHLKAMGMVNAFTGDLSDPNCADFSLMSDDIPLVISGVVHRTFIEVTEAGTRAAAVTAVTMAPASAAMPEEPKRVILDRPFLYMIVDTETNLPIFIGTVNSVN